MRPRLLVVVSLLCVSTVLPAQTPAGSPDDTPPAQATPQPKAPKPPPATATITGSVFCNDTRLPARGAIVIAQLIPRDGHVDLNLNSGSSRVGMDGTYSIQHLAPGEYTVVALLPGYFSPYDDLSVDGASIDAATRTRLISNGVVSARNETTSHFDITIQRGATISGRVLYDDGAPASQVVLDIDDVAKPPARKPAPTGNDDLDLENVTAGAVIRGMLLHQNQNTDDQGNFRISGIKPGKYRVVATPPNSADDGLDLFLGGFAKPGSLRIYSGNTFHKHAAKTYDLRAGDDVRDIEITIPVYAFHRIEGHVTTFDDRPIVAAAITLTDSSDDSFVFRARPARDGEFIFPAVPAGTYNLAVTGAKSGTVPDGYADSYPVAQLPLQNAQSFADKTTTLIVKDGDVTDLSIQLPQTATPNQPVAAAPAATTSSDPE